MNSGDGLTLLSVLNGWPILHLREILSLEGEVVAGRSDGERLGDFLRNSQAGLLAARQHQHSSASLLSLFPMLLSLTGKVAV